MSAILSGPYGGWAVCAIFLVLFLLVLLLLRLFSPSKKKQNDNDCDADDALLAALMLDDWDD